MFLRSHFQEGHGAGCQCGCSSKVIHYPQVAKTVAPTSESGASELLKDLEQPSSGHNCPSERFEDAEGVKSRVDGQKHAQGDYGASGILGDYSAGCHGEGPRRVETHQHEYDGNCHCVACYLDSKNEEQEKPKTEAELRAEEKAKELAVEQAIFRAGLQAKKYARKLAKKDAKLGGETKSQKKAKCP